MPSRTLLWIAAASFLVCLAAIATVDRPLAEYIHARGGLEPGLFRPATTLVEEAFGWRISKYLLGLLFAGGGLLLAVLRPGHWLAQPLVIAGVSHMAARLTAGLLKNVFERLRPEEVIQGAYVTGFFAADGNSFPSAHAAHFWSLFFPVALFCKTGWRWWALVIPVFISISRVAVNDHFLGDVLAGIGVAAVVTWGVERVLHGRFSRSGAAAGRGAAPVSRLGPPLKS